MAVSRDALEHISKILPSSFGRGGAVCGLASRSKMPHISSVRRVSVETYGAKRTLVRGAVRFRRQYTGSAGPEYGRRPRRRAPKYSVRSFEMCSGQNLITNEVLM